MKKEAKRDTLPFIEKIVLLALDDKGRFGNSEHRIRYGLAGAILFELEKEGKISISGDLVIVKTKDKTGDRIMDAALESLGKMKKSPSVKKSIQRIVYKSGLKLNLILKSLIRKEILKRQKIRFLRVFYLNKYPLASPEIKEQIIKDLYRKLMGDGEMTSHDLMLLSIMRTCRMIDKNYPLHEHLLKVRSRIREITDFPEPLKPSAVKIRIIREAISKSIVESNIRLRY